MEKCDHCGTDLSEKMKIRIDGLCLCYDCYMAKMKRRRSVKEIVRELYREGNKPSVIAQVTGVSAKTVYGILSEKNGGKSCY